MSLHPLHAGEILDTVRKFRTVYECSSFFEDAQSIQFFVRFRWWVPKRVQAKIKDDIHWLIVQRLQGPLAVKIY